MRRRKGGTCCTIRQPGSHAYTPFHARQTIKIAGSTAHVASLSLHLPWVKCASRCACRPQPAILPSTPGTPTSRKSHHSAHNWHSLRTPSLSNPPVFFLLPSMVFLCPHLALLPQHEFDLLSTIGGIGCALPVPADVRSGEACSHSEVWPEARADGRTQLLPRGRPMHACTCARALHACMPACSYCIHT
eukprot:352199-Chlamydomonas_euryale.AAC.15